MLNLASSSIVREGNKTLERCALTGPTPSVSLTSMRVLQAYSPARVGEVRRSCRTGVWCLSWNSAHYEKAPPAVIPGRGRRARRGERAREGRAGERAEGGRREARGDVAEEGVRAAGDDVLEVAGAAAGGAQEAVQDVLEEVVLEARRERHTRWRLRWA